MAAGAEVGDLILGAQPATNGTIEISGSNATLSSADFLTVGDNGTGVLNITGGATVSNGGMIDHSGVPVPLLIASEPDSTGTLNIGAPPPPVAPPAPESSKHRA